VILPKQRLFILINWSVLVDYQSAATLSRPRRVRGNSIHVSGIRHTYNYSYVPPQTVIPTCPLDRPLRCGKSNRNTLFSLDMLTYTYERQDIIQIALKKLPGGRGSAVKKKFVRFGPPFTC
jgi:hypothetical protein